MINKTADDLIKEVIDLEIYSLSPKVRSSKEELEKLFSEDFIEFGASGKVYTKLDVVNALPEKKENSFEVENIKAKALGVDVVQITYLLHNKTENKYSLRSSIWEWSLDGWRMIFHQGTNIQ